MFKTIKQLKPFWIYIGTSLFFWLSTLIFPNSLSLIIALSMIFIFPYISSAVVSFEILKSSPLSLKKTFLMGIIMFFSHFIVFCIPYIPTSIKYGIYRSYTVLYATLPSLGFITIFFIISLILYLRKTQKTKLLKRR